ncbi:restriction endonuclease subunit S [uncultured Succinatimonas sp.]|uniref:restriction endonuclease subunit S n=1 Tax=uncultured Succinatimonas sp. TaxID=1262973 RepID=UPI0025E54970|nr:restriction endonuclease subunit S [uncultured Succinatimonas sp.]
MYAVYHPLPDVVPQYIDYYFDYDLRLNKYLKPLVNIGAKHDMKVDNGTVLTGEVFFPSCLEQKKIVDFLTIIDELIRKKRTLVDALKKYKRGVMQHIFSRTPRQTVKEWTCVRLGDVFKKVSRRNTDGLEKNMITNSAEYGLIPQRDFFDKDIAVKGNTANYYVIEKGDFVYNPRKSNTAPYGPFNRYTLDEKGIISPLYTCLVLKADICPSYLAWYFRSDAWHRYIYDNGSQGVRHDRVSMTDDLLMGIPVIFPDQAKQQEYAKVLDKIEARIQVAQKEYDLLVKAKCGYVQQLFI